jgi:8-oxo-dGTP pyrophosphatase MutT (NUDIX family)
MDKNIKCKKGCCVLKFTSTLREFKKENALTYKERKSKRKSAGIAVITENRRLLLTQSYNNLWGVPKGKKEINETLLECALREVVEESGIKISSRNICDEFTFVPSYDKKLTIHIFKYLMSEMEYITFEMKNININDLHEDSTGFGWIKIDCLIDIVNDDKIKLNSLTKYILKKI